MRYESEAVEGYERPAPKLSIYVILATVSFLAAVAAAYLPCPGGISHY